MPDRQVPHSDLTAGSRFPDQLRNKAVHTLFLPLFQQFYRHTQRQPQLLTSAHKHIHLLKIPVIHPSSGQYIF